MTGWNANVSTEELIAHTEWLRRLARGLIGESATADDLVQDAWAVVGARSDVRREEVRPLLFGVARNLASRWRRGTARRTARERASARREALPSADELVERLETQRLVAEALEGLAEPYRRTLLLRYYHGLSATDIARSEDVAAGTVRARTSRGIDMLRARLAERFGEREGGWRRAFLPWLAPQIARRAPALTAPLALASVCLVALGAGATAWWLSAPTELRGIEPAPVVRLEGGNRGAAPGAVARLVASERETGPSPARVVEQGASASASSDAGRRDVTDRPSLRVVARVLDQDGAPVADALVRARFLNQEGSGQTDSLGHADFELSSRFEPEDGPEAAVSVEVLASGFADATLVNAEAEGVAWLGDIVLEPGGVFFGRVTDRDGAPVPDAEVVATAPVDPQLVCRIPAGPYRGTQARRRPTSRVRPREEVASRTDAAGHFRLERVPGPFATLWTAAPGRLWTATGPLAVRGEAEATEVVLFAEAVDPSRWIRGTLTDPDGGPVAGATVRSRSMEGLASLISSTTDAAGRFEVPVLEGNAQHVAVSPPVWEWDPIEVDGVAPGTQDLALRFAESRWFWVQVVDEAGEPVTGGQVSGLAVDERMRLPRVISDLWEDGRARLHEPREPFRVSVRADGHLSRIVGPFDPATTPQPLRIVLERAATVSGEVRVDGRVAAGVPVRLVYAPHRGIWYAPYSWRSRTDPPLASCFQTEYAATRTDDRGRFELAVQAGARPPEPDRAWFVIATPDGAPSAVHGPFQLDLGRGLAGLRLAADEGGVLEGRLVLAHGASAVGKTVVASNGEGGLRSQTLGPGGEYHFEHLRPGPWQLRAFEPGEAIPDTYTVELDGGPSFDAVVHAGQSTRFDLTAAPHETVVLGGQLTVDVGRTTAARTRAWTITLRSSPDNLFVFETLDAQGAFRVDLPVAGTWSLDLTPLDPEWAGLSVRDRITLVPGENAWARVVALGTLSGRIDLGETLRCFLSVEGPDGWRASRAFNTEESGAFGPIAVPAGEIALESYSRELFGTIELQPLLRSTVHVRAGELTELSLP